MDLSNILAYVAIAISASIRVSRIIGLIKFKDRERSTLFPMIFGIINNLLWLYYGVANHAMPIIITSVMQTCLDIICILLAYYYISTWVNPIDVKV